MDGPASLPEVGANGCQHGPKENAGIGARHATGPGCAPTLPPARSPSTGGATTAHPSVGHSASRGDASALRSANSRGRSELRREPPRRPDYFGSRLPGPGLRPLPWRSEHSPAVSRHCPPAGGEVTEGRVPPRVMTWDRGLQLLRTGLKSPPPRVRAAPGCPDFPKWQSQSPPRDH